eukprot:CAMPEP_0185846020 /NCGR_PEP_ID=MMETSP1354-20130828/1811_1 /TAXON_ID=708628 /ORGANISM="Erythrolobus madagascarensis, Strain CCMP3276" /LENGTH=643 /DNA_ID=CAMNT_0028546103 /DNA_START=23 /DNA_END=1954 /DNA_ORIENTATION=-
MDADEDGGEELMMDMEDDLADDELPDEVDESEFKEYRVKVRLNPTSTAPGSRVAHTRSYVAARFRSHLPDLASMRNAKLTRDGEYSVARRRKQRLDTERFLLKQRTYVGQRAKMAHELGGFSRVPYRVQKKLTLELHRKEDGEDEAELDGHAQNGRGGGADDEEEHDENGSDAESGGERRRGLRYRGTFDGEQKAAYAFLVLNEDDSVDLHPLGKHSWFSFRPQGALSEFAEKKAEDLTAEDAEAAMKKRAQTHAEKLQRMNHAVTLKQEQKELLLDFSRMDEKDAEGKKPGDSKKIVRSLTVKNEDKDEDEEGDSNTRVLPPLPRRLSRPTTNLPRDSSSSAIKSEQQLDYQSDFADDDDRQENEYVSMRDDAEYSGKREGLDGGVESSLKSSPTHKELMSDSENDEALTSQGRMMKRLLAREKSLEGRGERTEDDDDALDASPPPGAPRRSATLLEHGGKPPAAPGSFGGESLLKKRTADTEEESAKRAKVEAIPSAGGSNTSGAHVAAGVSPSTASPSALRASPGSARVSPAYISRLMRYKPHLPSAGGLLETQHIVDILQLAERSTERITIKDLVALLHHTGRLANNKDRLYSLVKQVARVLEQPGARPGTREYPLVLKDSFRGGTGTGKEMEPPNSSQ